MKGSAVRHRAFSGGRDESRRTPSIQAAMGCAASGDEPTYVHALPWSAWKPLAFASDSDMYSPCLVVP